MRKFMLGVAALAACAWSTSSVLAEDLEILDPQISQAFAQVLSEAADKIELLLEETKLMRAAPRKQSDEIERRGRLMDGDAAEIMRLLREIERLKAQLARTETALDNEFNNGIALCADIERLKMEAKVMK